jgi:hypothetical protein
MVGLTVTYAMDMTNALNWCGQAQNRVVWRGSLCVVWRGSVQASGRRGEGEFAFTDNMWSRASTRFIRAVTQIEASMVAVERIEEYCDVDQAPPRPPAPLPTVAPTRVPTVHSLPPSPSLLLPLPVSLLYTHSLPPSLAPS